MQITASARKSKSKNNAKPAEGGGGKVAVVTSPNPILPESVTDLANQFRARDSSLTVLLASATNPNSQQPFHYLLMSGHRQCKAWKL